MKLQELRTFIFIMVFMPLYLSAMEKNDQSFVTEIIDLSKNIYNPYLSPDHIHQAIKYPSVSSWSKVRVVCENGANSFKEIGTIADLQQKHEQYINDEDYMLLPNFFLKSQSPAGLLIIGLTNKNSSMVTMQFKKSV